ncbi:MAG: hypothetical protein P1U74_01060 [Legionellaceae bacterium]|nr:hypothetical protein [Legionellaceae bacterium]
MPAKRAARLFITVDMREDGIKKFPNEFSASRRILILQEEVVQD